MNCIQTIYYLYYTFFIMNTPSTCLVLPLGFAEQVLDLEMKLEEEESLEAIQILSKIYKIGVEYYLQHDLSKANYFQKRLNKLAVSSLNVQNAENCQPARRRLHRKMKEETEKINSYDSPYISSLVNQSQKSQKKINECVLADLNRQEERFQNRMLQRIKSAGKL